ncbi:hypothetical protein R1flu_004004 [Riccia fluitans]|uniref:Uncharacterized protein n=1 Tax=Riccia fluitans TaxID=41844 RepID=A0ABD1YP27_9MARC
MKATPLNQTSVPIDDSTMQSSIQKPAVASESQESGQSSQHHDVRTEPQETRMGSLNQPQSGSRDHFERASTVPDPNQNSAGSDLLEAINISTSLERPGTDRPDQTEVTASVKPQLRPGEHEHERVSELVWVTPKGCRYSRHNVNCTPAVDITSFHSQYYGASLNAVQRVKRSGAPLTHDHEQETSPGV